MDSQDLSTPRIPDEEITHLLLTLTDAFQLAASGDSRRGYLKVLGGLVRSSGFTLDQHAWAQDLRAHWDRALKAYLERHPDADLADAFRIWVPPDSCGASHPDAAR